MLVSALRILGSDLAHASRALRRQWIFSAVVIGSLATGIAAITGIGTAYDSLLYRLLPVRNASGIVMFTAIANRKDHARTQTFRYGNFLFLRDHLKTQSSTAAIETLSHQPVRSNSGLSEANIALVSPEYFSVLRTTPRLGNVLASRDAYRAVAVISDRYWRTHLGSDPAVLNQTLVVGGAPFLVIGVASPDFVGDDLSAPPDMWLPIDSGHVVVASAVPLNDAQTRLIGMLKPGMSRSASQAECEALYSDLLKSEAGSLAARMQSRLELLSDARGIVSQRESTSRLLSALSALAGLVLAASCVNAALLLASRAEGQRTEIATRFALGASRPRIFAHLFTGHLFLFSLATASGMLLAYAASSALVGVLGPEALPPVALLSSNSRLSPLALAVYTLLGVLFGVSSAFALTSSAGRKLPCLDTARVTRVSFFAYVVLTCQVALALALLSAALVCLNTVDALLQTDLGFERRNLVIAETLPSRSGLKTEKLELVYSQIQAALASTPGILSVSISSTGPLAANPLANVIRVPSAHNLEQPIQIVRRNIVSPNFFKTLHIPLQYGRVFASGDNSRARRVAIISQSMAQHYFERSNVLSSFLFIGADKEPIAIVGVVKDVKLTSPYDESADMLYLPAQQQTARLTHEVYIEMRVDPAAGISLATTIGRKIDNVSPGLQVPWIETADKRLSSILVTERLSAGLAFLFSVISVALACVGIYAVTSLVVERRTTEIAIRVALGASRVEVVQFVMRRTIMFVLFGIGVGIPCALASGQFISDQLTGVLPVSPGLLAFASFCALTFSTGSTALPAMRAAWMEPLKALRGR